MTKNQSIGYDLDNTQVLKVLKDPVLWGENFLKDRDGKKRKFWKHQRADLKCNDSYVIHQDGRSVGKSVSLVAHILYYAFTTIGGSALIAAPYQGQLDSIIDEMEFQIFNNNELETSVAISRAGNLKITRKPYYQIEFATGTILFFRPAGHYGESFRSLHVKKLFIDEAAWLSEKAWKALRMCLLPEGTMRIYSTPNGLRDSVYYRLTKTEKWKIFRWPSWISPLWTKEMGSRLLEFYGGKASPGWQHEVAGEHGKPAYGVFNLNQFIKCLDDVLEYRNIKITSNEFEDCEKEYEIQNRIKQILNFDFLNHIVKQNENRNTVYYLGADLGYTQDPLEFVLFKEECDYLRLVLRVHTEQVSYPVLSEIIAEIDDKYKPKAIGVDKGGNGLSVVQDLLTLDKYKKNLFMGRLFGVDFGSSTIIGYEGDKPVKKRTKEHMTSLITSALSNKSVRFPKNDQELEDQFSTHTYHIGERHIIYSNGNDSYCTFL